MLKQMEKYIKEPLKLNLQFFADPEDPPEDPPADPPEDDPKDKDTFTQSEVDSHISKAVDSALKKQQAKLEKEKQKAIDDAIAEKERLSKLSEKERKDEEMTKREKEIADRLAELERKELKADAVSDLNDKGLPADFADFLLADNAENTLNNINGFKKAFDEAVNAKVKEALRQDTPPAGGSGATTKNPFSKEHFNLTEQGRLLKDNPELYKQLKAQA